MYASQKVQTLIEQCCFNSVSDWLFQHTYVLDSTTFDGFTMKLTV